MRRWLLHRVCRRGSQLPCSQHLTSSTGSGTLHDDKPPAGEDVHAVEGDAVASAALASSPSLVLRPPAAIVTHSSAEGRMSVTIRSGSRRKLIKLPTQVVEPVKRIIFVRNGLSAANVDIGAYVTTPDWRIPLVSTGEGEAYRAGCRLSQIVGNEPVYFYLSPYLRCRQSFLHLMRGFEAHRKEHGAIGDNVIGMREDVRLRDGDIGRYKTKEELLHHLRERELYGKFYYRFPFGESGADVCDRVTSFLDAFQRERMDFPMDSNVVILTHGQTIRMFVKRWFNLTVDTYHLMVSPPTGSINTLTRMHHRSCFRLDTECVKVMRLPASLNEYNGYKYRNKQVLGSMSTGAPLM
ncbi:putative Histidine phosphatase superfamily (branch 1) [Trypanosoma vivax]|uniref:Putative phosphoglycerate mutase n=1 Tax=Trypanosoma vivax (strain Y486) TaxID=1055687 RepID=G0UAH9_TRYVY|nr:putative phosphoglycerate mutase [Trypanosoma vivax]KAH8617994.1 putative Histidine phosphatase superfamily (branch 1) [Trypanosoma vivax]CCC52812.1 putative phosphoglycerate mutase [Trypanosoma vivax Y486]